MKKLKICASEYPQKCAISQNRRNQEKGVATAHYTKIQITSFLIFTLLLTAFTSTLQGQTEAKTNSLWKAPLYDVYTHETFTEFQSFQQTIDLNAIDYPLLHAAIFYYTNSFRAKNSLPPLKWKLPLETAAYHHSREMAQRNFFDHYSPVKGHKEPSERVALAGVANPYTAENIIQNFALKYEAGKRLRFRGKGKFSYSGKGDQGFLAGDELLPMHSYLSCAKTLVDGWIDSPPHKKNMLEKKAIEMGVGAFIVIDSTFNDMPKIYSTQNFQWFKPIIEKEATDPIPPGHIEEELKSNDK